MTQEPQAAADRPANRLAHETSPYLLQHAHNPVDWYPWGPEAIEKAVKEDKPIFLSVGYSACHWCHVMERESFENPEIAAIMNRDYVNIKVDREERPDVDQIYMAAVQAMTGRGGWPMSVFLTPDLKPFYGGTYFPPEDRHGMPGFPRILQAVADAWTNRREGLLENADQLLDQLQGLGQTPPSGEIILNHEILDHALRALSKSYEPVHGGFGAAPKFPHPMDLRFLLRQFARTGDNHILHMIRHTLDKMARGGIYDHLGGGFARYSTDDRWLVPHFEKMLYDNALLATTYVEVYQATGETAFAQVARETLDYVLSRMTSPEGAFYATEDADSEGEEGKFYVWTLAEVEAILGKDRAKDFAYVYDVTPEGNWEAHNILNLPKPLDQSARILEKDLETLRQQLAEDRAKLFEVREKRIHPAKDTKILASWNGLMISALALAGPALREPRYTAAAEAAAGFVLDHMRQPDGRLWHGFKDNKARFNAYLDDYACVIEGLVALFEATGEKRWIDEALALAEITVDQFHDAKNGGFYYTGRDHETLVVRQKDLIDNATPSGNNTAATAFLRLAALTGRKDLAEVARGTLDILAPVLFEIPERWWPGPDRARLPAGCP